MAHGLSSRGARAQSLCSMQESPRAGIEPVSPALAGGLPATEPPRGRFPGNDNPLQCSYLNNLNPWGHKRVRYDWVTRQQQRQINRQNRGQKQIDTHTQTEFQLKKNKEIKQERKISSTNVAGKTGCSVEKQKQNLDTYS